MELGELSRIIALARAHAVAELEIVHSRGRVRFRCADTGFTLPAPGVIDAQPSVVPAGTPHDEAIRLAELFDNGRLHLVRAPWVGLFLPLEAGDEVVVVGSRVAIGAPLGAIKSLGVTRSVISPVSGVIAAVYARAGDPLHYGHLIVGIETDRPLSADSRRSKR